MVIGYINIYLDYLENIFMKKNQNRFLTIDQYLLEKKVPEREEIEKLIFEYLLRDEYIKKMFFELIKRTYKNEIIGLNEFDFEFTPKFYKEMNAFFSGEKKELSYFSNAYELLFLFSFELLYPNVLDEDLNFLKEEALGKNGDFIYAGENIIQVIDYLLRDKSSKFLGRYFIKSIIEGLDKRVEKNFDKIQEYFESLPNRYSYFNENFDDIFAEYIELNSSSLKVIYSIIHRSLKVNKVIIRDFKIRKVR